MTISIDSHDSNIDNDICRYYYDIYNKSKSTYPLVSNVNYGFKVPNEGFNFEFNVEGETNPAYYILFNKLESGDLNITINNKAIIISDSYPYRGIYVNRKNLFKECADKEPYNCKLNMKISGQDIPFTLLIRDAQDNSIASYIPHNEMILGMSESVSPLYFYTDIKPIVKEKYLLIIKKEFQKYLLILIIEINHMILKIKIIGVNILILQTSL